MIRFLRWPGLLLATSCASALHPERAADSFFPEPAAVPMAGYLALALKTAGERPLWDRRDTALTIYRLSVWHVGYLRTLTMEHHGELTTLSEHIADGDRKGPVRRQQLDGATYQKFLAYLPSWEIWERSGQMVEPGIDSPLYFVESLVAGHYQSFASGDDLAGIVLAAQWLETLLEPAGVQLPHNYRMKLTRLRPSVF